MIGVSLKRQRQTSFLKVDGGRGKLQGEGGIKRDKVIKYIILLFFLLKILSPCPPGILYLPLPFIFATGRSSLPVSAGNPYSLYFNDETAQFLNPLFTAVSGPAFPCQTSLNYSLLS
jgi:hypothetical protein